MEQKTYNQYNSYIFKTVCNNENEKRQIEFNKKRQIEFNEELQFEFDEKYLNNIQK
jgi:hypothetical protein